MNTATIAGTNLPRVPDDAIAREIFAAWSRVYDHQPNPLLSLEERFLGEMLPGIRGLDVVDVGCGTGRWLARLAPRGCNSLTGVDSSPAMLDRARAKLGASVTVLSGGAASVPLSDRCADLLLASFVASYVPDLPQFAAEVRRVLRAGGRVYLSDLHPATASACGWKRGFKIAGESAEPIAYLRSVGEVISCFGAHGFEVALCLEPPFGAPEQNILKLAGKTPAFEAAAGRPAIYILQMELGGGRSGSKHARRELSPQLSLAGARLAFGPGESACAEISLANGKISSIGCSHLSPAHRLNLDGYLVLPGLTNSHDHLEFGLFPNLGHGLYTNFQEWTEDIHKADRDVIERQRRIPKDVRLWWGAIRNLLCGVTTVCHHNPLDPVLLGDDFPVRVLTSFGWAHSLAMDPGLRTKFRATPENLPFVLHAAEGLDPQSADEIFQLDRMQALNGRTVVVHGLGLTDHGISVLNRRGAALVWCPTSNQFLFGRTLSWKAVASVNKPVLGSDSPLTAAGDLMDEIRYAHSEVGVAADEIYRMAITRPAAVFRFEDGRGAIRPGATADLIAVRDAGASPAKALTRMSSGDVELVIVAGRVQLASGSLFERLPHDLASGLQPLEVDGQVVWVRARLGRLFGEVAQILGSSIVLGKKKVHHVCTEWI